MQERHEAEAKLGQEADSNMHAEAEGQAQGSEAPVNRQNPQTATEQPVSASTALQEDDDRMGVERPEPPFGAASSHEVVQTPEQPPLAQPIEEVNQKQ